MKVLITGTSGGIGKAIASLFLEKGHSVFGIDRNEASISHNDYVHFVCDVRDYEKLPELCDIDILINNAGTQNED
ncbi:MAG: SDR family oxidoreductase, partial [Oscillospiraceae bacterium]|nr:SDR family oxidoreductase [Oscillospiraceae bacterium]